MIARGSARRSEKQCCGPRLGLDGLGRKRRNELVEVLAQNESALPEFAHGQAAILDEIVKRGTTDPEDAGGLGNRKR
jgi:hypothetical protein